jgi:hypothetical protein
MRAASFVMFRDDLLLLLFVVCFSPPKFALPCALSFSSPSSNCAHETHTKANRRAASEAPKGIGGSVGRLDALGGAKRGEIFQSSSKNLSASSSVCQAPSRKLKRWSRGLAQRMHRDPLTQRRLLEEIFHAAPTDRPSLYHAGGGGAVPPGRRGFEELFAEGVASSVVCFVNASRRLFSLKRMGRRPHSPCAPRRRAGASAKRPIV